MMKYVLMAAALAAPISGWADCQIFASQQKVSWSKLSAAERQQAQGQAITLPEKQIQVQVVCTAPQRIRLFVSSDLAQNDTFALGPYGEMHIVASDAHVDDKSVRLAPVNGSEAISASGGSETADVALNQTLAFMDGQEVAGKTASVTFTIKSKVQPGSITEKTTWHGNLKIKMEAR